MATENELPIGLRIPTLMGTEFIADSDKDDLEKIANQELERREKEKRDALNSGQDKDVDTEITDEKIQALTTKAKEKPSELTEEEIKTLVKAGVIDDPEEEEKNSKKLEELLKKDAKTLTDEEKKFIEDNKREPELITSLKQNLSQKLGTDIKGEYTNDEEGALKLFDDISNLRAKAILEGAFNENKKLKDFYTHFIVEGRSPETFILKNTEPAFKSIKLEQTSDINPDSLNKEIIANQRRILETFYVSKGLSKDEYEPIINGIEQKGELYQKSVATKQAMEKAYKESVDKQLEEEKKFQEEEEKKIEEHWNNVKETISKNNFNGFSIPKEDLPLFMDAVLNPINDQGITKMDVIRNQKLTLEKTLLFDYMLLKDMKVPGLTPHTNAKTARVLKFKQAKEDNKNRKTVLAGVNIPEDFKQKIKVSMRGMSFND